MHSETQTRHDFLEQCVLCGASSSQFHNYSNRDGYAIQRCGKCELIFVNPRDDQDTVLRQYNANLTSPIDYYLKTAPTDRVVVRKKLEKIESRMRKGRLLDIGCNVGTFMEVARERGWQTLGLEPNKAACAECEKKGLPVLNAFLNAGVVDQLRSEKFDLVCMNDSIEHFPNPLDAVQRVSDLLPVGGMAVLSTPNIDSPLSKIFQVKPKEHLFYFSRETFAELLKRAGFKIELAECVGRLRAVGAMHNGASLNPTWVVVAKALNALGLDQLVGAFLESFFKDELFFMARKEQ